MTDYIKREDALNFEMEIESDPQSIQLIMDGMARMSEYIKTIPAAEVKEVKHGRWVYFRTGKAWDGWTHRQYRCSLCGRFTVQRDKYCPECGAQMELNE